MWARYDLWPGTRDYWRHGGPYVTYQHTDTRGHLAVRQESAFPKGVTDFPEWIRIRDFDLLVSDDLYAVQDAWEEVSEAEVRQDVADRFFRECLACMGMSEGNLVVQKDTLNVARKLATLVPESEGLSSVTDEVLRLCEDHEMAVLEVHLLVAMSRWLPDLDWTGDASATRLVESYVRPLAAYIREESAGGFGKHGALRDQWCHEYIPHSQFLEVSGFGKALGQGGVRRHHWASGHLRQIAAALDALPTDVELEV